MVAFFSSLLDTSRQHDDSTTVTLPDHAPEVVASRVQRPLCDDEFTWGIVTRHVVCVYVIGALFVVDGLELEAAVVVRQDVGETILRTIAWQVCCSARLVTTDMFQFLELFGEPEVRVC